MEPRIAFLRHPDGQRIAYMTRGKGPVLVAPPGWLSHLELQWPLLGMDDFYERLAESFQLVFYDRRGCGLSERSRDDFTLDGEVTDLECVIDQATDGPVSLLGVSQAVPISIRYAVRHPERVRHLVLFGAYHMGKYIARPELRESLVALVRASWGVGSRAMATIFVPGDDPTFRDNLARLQREVSGRDMAAELLEAVYRVDVSEDLPKVKAPTLVIHRRDDRAIVSRFGLELAAGIPNARLVLLEGDIHFPWLGDWEPIASLIEDFASPEGRRERPTSPVPPASAMPSEPRPRFRVLHYRVGGDDVRSNCRVALAEIGEEADFPLPTESGLFRLRAARVDHVRDKVRAFVERAAAEGAHLVVFPEMSVDLGHAALEEEVYALARAHALVIVSGGHHDEVTRHNVCRAIGPEGLLWQQRKHIPAVLRSDGGWIEERIETPPTPIYVVASTALGRIAITICRDFLHLDVRVALKNTEPAIDLVLNPAFTPVAADFDAAHFEARRSLYACTAFCNFARFGGSHVESPEKRTAVHIPPGEERVEVVDIPLLAIREERRAWDERARRRFIQSTRR
jgi:pimeloyl-ACP methyl ester carboxylesterase/predicted amidohydrolase